MVLTPLDGEVKGNDYDGENEVFGAKYKEKITPGTRTLISTIAGLSLSKKEFELVENKFQTDHGSIGPVTMLENRYKWHKLMAKTHISSAKTVPATVAHIGLENNSDIEIETVDQEIERILEIRKRKFPNAGKNFFKIAKKPSQTYGTLYYNEMPVYSGDICMWCCTKRPTSRPHHKKDCWVPEGDKQRQRLSESKKKGKRTKNKKGYKVIRVIDSSTEDSVGSDSDTSHQDQVGRIEEIFENDISPLNF